MLLPYGDKVYVIPQPVPATSNVFAHHSTLMQFVCTNFGHASKNYHLPAELDEGPIFDQCLQLPTRTGTILANLSRYSPGLACFQLLENVVQLEA